jgi:uncharacterized protein YbaR (Trm112 family)
MISLKRRLDKKTGEIRCFKLIDDPKNHLYGLECNKLLMKLNDKGEAAGEIVCRHCKTKYNISNNIIEIIKGE